VPAHDPFLLAAASGGVLAYGPAPGVELIPYFLALLGWVGLAFAALILSPITALVRRLRRGRGAPLVEPKGEPAPGPVPEPPGEAKHDNV
jgi:hypothetical protein